MASCELVIEHRCSECGRVEEQRVPCAYGLSWTPCPPASWRLIEERLVCDQHTVSVVIDGLLDEEITRRIGEILAGFGRRKAVA